MKERILKTLSAWRLTLGAMLLITAISLPTRVEAASLTLTWTQDSTNVDGFKIERSNGSTYAEVATAGASVRSYTDSGLVSGTTYCYRVRSFNSAEYSDYSNQDCATAPPTLMLSKAGVGSGTVNSTPTGINCGSDCSHAYSADTVVTLSATPLPGSIFAGWSGGTCTGTGVCGFVVYGDTSVTATFDLQPSRTVTLISPSGAITSSTPTYTWNALAHADWYFLWVENSPADIYFGEGYAPSDAGCASGTGTCSVTASTVLTPGETYWSWVRSGYLDGSVGPWSNRMSFTVMP